MAWQPTSNSFSKNLGLATELRENALRAVDACPAGCDSGFPKGLFWRELVEELLAGGLQLLKAPRRTLSMVSELLE